MNIVNSTQAKTILTNASLKQGEVYEYVSSITNLPTGRFYLVTGNGKSAVDLADGIAIPLDSASFRWIHRPNAELHV